MAQKRVIITFNDDLPEGKTETKYQSVSVGLVVEKGGKMNSILVDTFDNIESYSVEIESEDQADLEPKSK